METQIQSDGSEEQEDDVNLSEMQASLEEMEKTAEMEKQTYAEWLATFLDWHEEAKLINVADTFQDGFAVVRTPKGETHFTCPRTLPHPKVWPTKPLLLRVSLVHHGWNADKTGSLLPTNGIPFSFETELFKGEAIFRLRGLESAKSYFDGRARLSSIVITGQFKEELPVEDVMTGQEFCKPIKQPNAILAKAVTKFFKLLAPLLQLYVGKQTYFLSPMAQTVQVMHISDDPVTLTPDIDIDDNFGQEELGQTMDRFQRKKFFSKRQRLKEFRFRTNKFYTFDFYNDKIDLENFRLKALGQEFDIQKYLRGQPLRILSRVFSPGNPKSMYLWNFELWNEKVIEYLPSVETSDK